MKCRGRSQRALVTIRSLGGWVLPISQQPSLAHHAASRGWTPSIYPTGAARRRQPSVRESSAASTLDPDRNKWRALEIQLKIKKATGVMPT